MSANSDSFVAKTSLDYIAEGYWQDYLAQRPIASGIAYESQLHACQLDESLASLQRVDRLLSQIRRDIVKKNIASINYTEEALLADDRFRNLLLFIAFYAGRVLALQWQTPPHWYSQSELRRRHPKLSMNVDDFYQEMAVVYYCAGKSDKGNTEATTTLFFALEPIGLRLFGNIDRQFVAVQGSSVASGLYQALKERLPDVVDTTETINKETIKATEVTANAKANTKPATHQEADKQKLFTDKSAAFEEQEANALLDNTLPTTATQPRVAKNDNNNAVETNTDIANEYSNQQLNDHKTVNKKVQPTPELFSRLLTELDEIKVPQSVGVDDYQQARKTLDQFERHIARQSKPREQIIFSETHQAARQQALLLLQKSANAGNTAAMLRLARSELLGEGLAENDSSTVDNKEANKEINKEISKEAGVNLVKQAATAKDSRAQRFLSRLYYQGVGVPQDIAMGKYWLEQAADNNHPEAIALNKQWQQAQLLIETQKQEQHSFKRYQLLIGIVAVVALLLIVFV